LYPERKKPVFSLEKLHLCEKKTLLRTPTSARAASFYLLRQWRFGEILLWSFTVEEQLALQKIPLLRGIQGSTKWTPFKKSFM
jgi:hypothetical protein